MIDSAQAEAKQRSFSMDLGDYGLQEFRIGNVEFPFD